MTNYYNELQEMCNSSVYCAVDVMLTCVWICLVLTRRFGKATHGVSFLKHWFLWIHIQPPSTHHSNLWYAASGYIT